MDHFAASRELSRVRTLVVVGLGTVLGLLLMLSAPASAAQAVCDPAYGCSDSKAPEQINPHCELSTTSAAPGTRITATITDIPAGSAVSLLFDGNEMGTTTADAGGKAAMTFGVPNNSGSDHTVVFSGPGFGCDATSGEGFGVLGLTVTRPSQGGSLAATGARIAVFVAIGILAIVVGAELVRASRRRQRELTLQLRREMRSYASRR